MTRIRWIAIALLTVLAVSACNTISGVGKDIKSAGTAIEGAGSKR